MEFVAAFALAWLYPTAWLFLALGWIATLPIFIARKHYLSAHPFSYANQFTAYRTSLFSRKARVILAAYILGASIYLFSFAFTVTWLQPARSYLPLTRTTGRDLISINERFVYLVLPVLATTIGYAARQITNGREILKFDGPQVSRYTPHFPQCLKSAIVAGCHCRSSTTAITLTHKFTALARIVLQCHMLRIVSPVQANCSAGSHISLARRHHAKVRPDSSTRTSF